MISIISIMLSLTIPAVQRVRESARLHECQNKGRQLGLALQNFESTHSRYPSDGWGWGWVGDGQQGGLSTLDGPGGWIHHLLPFLEQQELWEQTKTRQGRNLAIQQPIGVFTCPSRRDAVPYPYTLLVVPLRNADIPALGSRSDYAICAGDRIISIGPGPDTVELVSSYPFPNKTLYSGISFVRSNISSRDVFDGTSTTLAISEKLVIPLHYHTGQSFGDDQTILIGDDADIRRWTHFTPLWDYSQIDDIERFGSAHDVGVTSVNCDGSVHTIDYAVDSQVWKSLGNRADTK